MICLLLVSGCGIIRHNVTSEQFIEELHRISNKNSVNIMYYDGTNERFHYFTYVYGMVLSRKKFKVPIQHLEIPEYALLKREEGAAWQIAAIDDVWHATYGRPGHTSKAFAGITIYLADKSGKSDLEVRAKSFGGKTLGEFVLDMKSVGVVDYLPFDEPPGKLRGFRAKDKHGNTICIYFAKYDPEQHFSIDLDWVVEGFMDEKIGSVEIGEECYSMRLYRNHDQGR